MVTAIRETERKYAAPPGMPLPDLRGLPAVASQSASGEVNLEATYYDTATYDLARAGITLRHRIGGADAGWHLKVPSGDESRVELRLPMGGSVPAEFTELLTARLRGRTLHPVATISTRRQVSTLADESGAPLAEIALDAVTAETMGPTATLRRWSELEVELAQSATDDCTDDRAADHADGRALLKAADRALRRCGLSRSPHRMKLEVALADALPSVQSPTGPIKTGAARDAVLAYVRGRYDELLHQDMLVRRSEPDAVHQMRVAARRIRAAFQEFGRIFRATDTAQLIGELRWLGQELGHARDEEVLNDLLLKQADHVPVESLLGPVRARITGTYAPRQAAAERQLRVTLASERYLDLLESLEDFLANPPLAADAEERASSVLPRVVGHSQRRVRRRMRAALDSPAGSERDSALHDARKAAKRARYAAEAAVPVVGKQAAKSAKALKKVQSALGDQHDAVIAGSELRDLAIRAHADGENAYTYGLLHQRQNERAAALADRAAQRWRRADRTKRKAWMR